MDIAKSLAAFFYFQLGAVYQTVGQRCVYLLRLQLVKAGRGEARRGEARRDAALSCWPALPVRFGPVRFGSARSAVAHHVTCQPNEILHRIHMAHRVL